MGKHEDRLCVGAAADVAKKSSWAAGDEPENTT